MTTEQNKSPPPHTPRPWIKETQDGGSILILDSISENKIIATITHPPIPRFGIRVGSEDEMQANARLIAAAPDLLIAAEMEDLLLRYIRQEISGHQLDVFLERHGRNPKKAPVDFISDYRRAAIAKARGHQ